MADIEQPSTTGEKSLDIFDQPLDGTPTRLTYSRGLLLALREIVHVRMNPAWQENFDMVKSHAVPQYLLPTISKVKTTRNDSDQNALAPLSQPNGKTTRNSSDQDRLAPPSQTNGSPSEASSYLAQPPFYLAAATAISPPPAILLLDAAKTHFEYVCKTLKGGVDQADRAILDQIGRLICQIGSDPVPVVTDPSYTPSMPSYPGPSQRPHVQLPREIKVNGVEVESQTEAKKVEEVEACVVIEEDEEELQARKARIADSMSKRRKEQSLHESLLEASKKFEAAQKKDRTPSGGFEVLWQSKSMPPPLIAVDEEEEEL
ncbi:MAG: hypothetical protein Q9220_004758 [cf. Caloplaca sp. 1 TL-2023]